LLDWNNAADRDVNSLLFSGLVRFDERGLPRADLAESWGVSQDGTIYNFTLRPNALWHDGTPVTSEDVIFTIDMMKSDGSLYPQDIKDLWSRVEVEELNESNLKFTLPEPFVPFIDYLTFGVLPKHRWNLSRRVKWSPQISTSTLLAQAPICSTNSLWKMVRSPARY
jgi:peptide/nickel transport system substrate-binding protein